MKHFVIGVLTAATLAGSLIAQDAPTPQRIHLMQTKAAALLITRTDAQAAPGMAEDEMAPVFFQVTIGTDGKIASAVPLRDQKPNSIHAAEEALRDWRWHPVQYQGHPVVVDTILAVHFGMHSHMAKPFDGWKPEGNITLDEDDAENLIAKKVNPAWPQGATGVVRLMGTLNEQGAIENLAVKDAPSPQAGTAAVAAVKQWKFHPLVLDTKAVAVDIPIVLKIK